MELTFFKNGGGWHYLPSEALERLPNFRYDVDNGFESLELALTAAEGDMGGFLYVVEN